MSYQSRLYSVAERLKEALFLTGTKQIELARLTHLDRGTINNYITGKYEPKQDKLSIIADALGVDPVWLMGYDVPMERQKKTPDKQELSEGEKLLLELFRQVPVESQQMVLDMIKIALKK